MWRGVRGKMYGNKRRRKIIEKSAACDANSKVVGERARATESILSGRGAEQRSMKRNYQSPARFRHVAVVVLPLLCLLRYRGEPSDSPLNVTAISALTPFPQTLPLFPSIS